MDKNITSPTSVSYTHLKEAFNPFNKIYTKENLRDFLAKLSSNIDETAGIDVYKRQALDFWLREQISTKT